MTSKLESIVDDLVVTAFGDRSSREQFLFRESLRNLVRLAQAEQRLDIRTSALKLTGAIVAPQGAHKVRIDES